MNEKIEEYPDRGRKKYSTQEGFLLLAESADSVEQLIRDVSRCETREPVQRWPKSYYSISLFGY
jgi:hypothetical protein